MTPALPPPPPAIITPVRQHAPAVAPATQTTSPLSPQQTLSVLRLLAALQRDRARPFRGMHFGERQRVAMYRSRGGGKRGRR
jgi:hypothetical protein